MINLLCYYCSNLLKDPIECKNCHENFCQEHANNFNKCPLCKKEPFNCTINNELKKLLKKYENDITNKKIKMDEDIIQCNLCSFEGAPGYLCYHLAEEHKKELIETFGKKKIYQIENIEPQLVPQEIKFKKYESVDSIQDNLIENGQSGIIKRLNSEKIKNNINFLTERKTNEKTSENSLSKSQITKLFYCKKAHQTINCICCSPDHICCEGNCLCVKCMNFNVKAFNLKDGQLYNKAGRIAKPENGEYHCEMKFNNILYNSVGQKFNSQITCSYVSKYFCKECKILNKYKNIYLDYISKNKLFFK